MDAGTPYHRLARLRPEWSPTWRPLLTVFIALVAYTILASLLLVVAVLGLSALGLSSSALGGADGPEAVHPLAISLVFAFAALGWPAAAIGVRLGGWRPAGWLWSVEGRARTWPLRSGMVWFILALGGVVPPVIEMLFGNGFGLDGRSTAEAALAIGAVVVLGPLGAIGAEMFLRGMMMQVFGAWFRSAFLAGAVAVLCGLFGHTQGPTATLNAVILGAGAAVLAWKSGGLELPVLFHAAIVLPVTALWVLGGPGFAHASSVLFSAIILVIALAQMVDRHAGQASTISPVVRPADAPVPPPVTV